MTYDAAAHTATGTVNGVLGENLSGLDLSGTTHTSAGDFPSDAWTFTDVTGNYNNTGGTTHDHIDKANATIVVTGYSVTYDGNPHTAVGTATGVGGANLAVQLTLSGTTHTAAGDYPSDSWSFSGGTNYNDASGAVHDSIAKATATILVTPYSVTYDGNPHLATGTATGVKGESLSGLDLSGTTHTYAGNYTDTWTFTDVTGNYNNASSTVPDSIAKASSTTTVTCPASVTYNGAAQTPCSASVTGVGGLNQSLTPSYSNNINAGTATASASFAGDANHTGSSHSKNFTIAKANATIVVTPYNVTYDGAAHTATGTAKGVLGENLTGLNLSGTSHTNPGSYLADPWTFTDVTGNYNNTNGTVKDYILFASGRICNNGLASHIILQPINVDGTSVFKAGSTVPTKFAVCDAFGNSIGPNAAFSTVVKSYIVVAATMGTVTGVDETAYSTTPDQYFRWDPTAQQWIFNQATGKSTNLTATNATYVFQITLIDGTIITQSVPTYNGMPGYQYGLK